MDILQDDNFQELHSVVIWGILPRALILIAIAAIFTMLSNRTANLFSILLLKEEQLFHSHNEMVMGFATLVENKDGSIVKAGKAYR